ncbi:MULTISPECIES: nucleotidyltransferase domain-containing protein [Bradyrhizobium]|uniref:Nucleotidyltransferase domain-containing protein n=1 Tax=Bradyrhizobium elkanii TaxID=29448 RepID=A0A4U6S7B2_BRAEL|nr:MULTISPECIES: nucleotidyltransferase domain-containing protein [Bradyrhizobium]MTV14571.1 nucleotidyltransferase domain-containing protein [Bradyrhizobium sp. BR2003]TKV82903.1 nucleotidyltransferase domain-containing protein [Bradyrhizobium elkanii]
MSDDPLLARIIPVVAAVPGVAAIVLGGSRARGTAHDASDTDVGLYYRDDAVPDIDRLREAVTGLVDDPAVAHVTPVGEWGPWIVGGAWLTIGGRKVDLLYRSIDQVSAVIDACRNGEISMHYQPGHPHGFCSAIWMGEVALCRALHDPDGLVAALKARTAPYPPALRDALVRRFQWEVLFSIENAELALPRGDGTHIAGCAYRALACIAQVLFALNGAYPINEKGALAQAANFPVTVRDLAGRATEVWRQIGATEHAAALQMLRVLESDLQKICRVS